MRITNLRAEPIHELRFLSAAKGGGTESQRLLFLSGQVDSLPDGLDALVLTGDLQGVFTSWRHGGKNVLLGIQGAEELVDLADAGTIPDCARTGVVLAGDFYAAPNADKRGATGDVREVWKSFAAMHPLVAGVAGNHDLFGTSPEAARFRMDTTFDLLDASIVSHGDLRVGGVGYVIGNPAKPGRREESEFLAALEHVAAESPDILVMHEGPSGGEGQRGNARVRAIIESSRVGLVVCGHVHWDAPLAMLGGDTQVANVDCRVIVLTLDA